MTRRTVSAFPLTNLLANRLLIPALRSRAGARLGRRLAVVEYQGRRTGKHRQLVTHYTQDGPKVSIEVGMAERKTWWRNFRAPQPLCLRLAGHDYDAIGHVVREGSAVHIIADLDDPGGKHGQPSDRATDWSVKGLVHETALERGNRRTPGTLATRTAAVAPTAVTA